MNWFTKPGMRNECDEFDFLIWVIQLEQQVKCKGCQVTKWITTHLQNGKASTLLLVSRWLLRHGKAYVCSICPFPQLTEWLGLYSMYTYYCTCVCLRSTFSIASFANLRLSTRPHHQATSHGHPARKKEIDDKIWRSWACRHRSLQLSAWRRSCGRPFNPRVLKCFHSWNPEFFRTMNWIRSMKSLLAGPLHSIFGHLPEGTPYWRSNATYGNNELFQQKESRRDQYLKAWAHSSPEVEPIHVPYATPPTTSLHSPSGSKNKWLISHGCPKIKFIKTYFFIYPASYISYRGGFEVYIVWTISLGITAKYINNWYRFLSWYMISWIDSRSIVKFTSSILIWFWCRRARSFSP